jgi:hypothetical protein
MNITKLRVKTESFQSKLETPSNSDDNDWMLSTLLLLPSVLAVESSTSGLTEKPKETPLPQPRTHSSRPGTCLDMIPQIYYTVGFVALDMCLAWTTNHTGQETLFLDL